ncbi:hypothetical protein E1211_03170 [Micromonospora sp. 15K316]|uniref:hypothetical protein n=1 Tax=Micromonospora sp. 15K316 TaxID=2530376 RepID=UPI0010458BE2|nr:hypothetical protein [Micromonospora sp. 15K316]TDC39779.1 hypothetical protein E1211_03170 [Micromonospora sp. 15K316]
MNLTDLRRVLDERSGEPVGHDMPDVRLHGVRAKVAARRRRRIAVWTACAVVALGGVATAAVLPGAHTGVAPTTADSPAPVRTTEGFPEYAYGARLVAAKSAALPERRLELTIVPATLDLVVSTRCDDALLQEELTINGHVFDARGDCGQVHLGPGWDRYDITVGEPAKFVLTITGARSASRLSEIRTQVPAAGTFGLAIGERVPLDEYPVPPRPPKTLGPLALPAGCTALPCQDFVIIRSDPADPSRPVRQSVRWKTVAAIHMVAQTPGLLHLRVNGIEITTGRWSDYSMNPDSMYGDQDGRWQREFGLNPRPGDPVSIEIVPEGVTGAWQVVFAL